MTRFLVILFFHPDAILDYQKQPFMLGKHPPALEPALYGCRSDYAWDPRHNNVVLYENRYWGHIVGRHPGIEVEHIRLVLEDPDVITDDEGDGLVENYYRQHVVQDALK